MSSVDVNGKRLYCEERGRGPAVLYVSGATGDAGHWAKIADILADTYKVITYDRRANSRSPRPARWVSTTIGEQAARRPAARARSSTGDRVRHQRRPGR
jgi:pimeloyl-ACP methyl ester carboxylesterase